MLFYIVKQDITEMQVDAIVNTANTSLQLGAGICGTIFKKAGTQKMRAACNKLAPIRTGQAVMTRGFNLPAKHVIHAAVPTYDLNDPERCQALLHSACAESLKLARKHHCKSIALPLISSKIYGYPKDKALEIARHAIEEFLSEHDMEVYLTVFDRVAFVLDQALLREVESYLFQHHIISSGAYHHPPKFDPELQEEEIIAHIKNLNKVFGILDETFSETLLKLIDAKGKTDVEIYKRANIDRKLFSKIRKGHGYTPKKPTILALAVALELTLEETKDLLFRAGYALSSSIRFDAIVEYFIINGKYDIHEINEVLFYYDQPLLGRQD